MSPHLPLVSIGMPVYNGEEFIREALDSLLAQDYGNLELVISDNASTDRTFQICQEYQARDNRVRYHRNEQTLGAVRNFNRALELSSGQYLMWAAHDDVWEPSYVSTLLAALLSDSGSVLAFSAFDNINERGEAIRTYPDLFELPSVDMFHRLRNYLVQEEHLGKANLIYGLMRRRTIQAAGGFTLWGKGSWGVDMLVVFRLLSLGNLALSGKLLFHKRLVRPSADPAPRSQGKTTSPIACVVRCCSANRDWQGYFSGYARIISGVESLTIGQKTRLRLALSRRRAEICLREGRKCILHPAVRWARKHCGNLMFGKGS